MHIHVFVCVHKILTVDSGMSTIIIIWIIIKYICMQIHNINVFLSFFLYAFLNCPGNLWFCRGKSIFLWQLARLARPQARSQLSTCWSLSTYHHEPFLHEQWCNRPIFTFGSLFDAFYWNFCLFFDFLHDISCRSPHFSWLVCFDRWAGFFRSFLSVVLLDQFSFYVFIFKAF